MDSELLYLLAQEGVEIGNPYIVVYRSAAYTPGSTGSQVVPFDTKTLSDSLSTNSMSSSLQTSGAIYVPVTGLYTVSASITLGTAVNNDYVQLGVAVNASSNTGSTTLTYRLDSGLTDNTASRNLTISGAITVPLTGGTYVNAVLNETSTTAFVVSSSNNWMSVAYVGAA